MPADASAGAVEAALVAARPARNAPVPILGNVQALRALAVVMILAVHVGNPLGFERRYLGGQQLLGWLNLPGQAGVDLFFVISGLIMTITTWSSDHDGAASRRFLARRFRRIYPIYWFVSALVLIVFVVQPGLVNSHSAHQPEVLQSFLLAPQPGLPLLAVGWTLTYEMYFYLVFAAALLAPRRRLPWILGAWGAVTCGFAAAFPSTTVPVLSLLADPLLLEFIFGVGVGYLVMTRRPFAPAALLAAGVVCLAVAVAFAGRIDDVTLDHWYRTITVGPAAALIVLGAVGVERQRRLVASPRLQYIGDASYSIYLWHLLLLVTAGRVIGFVLSPPAGPVLHVVLLIAVPTGVLAACLVLYELVERPLLRAVSKRRSPRPRRPAV
jgi:exopolysaccharide production protein ExoZ